MIIEKIYKNRIVRPLNPAVSAEDFNSETVKTEIDEYVFTDEIINGLFNVLNAIWTQNVSHNGIWINGFFGSGKSHFLKFLGYCIEPKYQEAALARLLGAAKERDPLTVPDTNSTVTIDDMQQLSAWLRKAEIDVVLFNIGTVHDTNSEEKEVFTQVFWNQFNRFRGYNSFNLALAQNLEKVLDNAGKFAEFKSRLAEEDFDWEEQASMLATIMLDHVLEIAKDILPILTLDSLRKAIMDNKENVSPEAFCKELKEFIDKKQNKNYRMIFLVDEVSQFIGDRKELLLQLQEVVTGLHRYCDDKAWVTCTAQQDLSQVLTNVQIVQTNADYGKIMGRFEVRVSLKGSQTEYITQKRLLDKNEEGIQVLEKVWDEKHLAIEDQFALPTSFHSFRNEKEFVDYYPFVPYQFSLIGKVLDSFGSLRYIDSQSRGNERSIIKITHSTAIKAKDDEIGKFIAFDRFYNAMFEGALMASGRRAKDNADAMIKEYVDQGFAQRVVNVLFMICNLSAPNKLVFPATKEHIVTLLMEDVDTNKAELIARTEQALGFLDQKHVIRVEKFSDGRADVYCFQSEDEIDAAREIESQEIDQASMANYFAQMFRTHFKCGTSANKETYGSRSFSIGWQIYGRNFYANNADINVEFALGKNQGVGSLFGTNEPNKLTFNVEAEFSKDKLLVNDFFWYCQVQKWSATALNGGGQTREKTRKAFGERALDVYNTRIVPKMNAILNHCDILSGNTVINVNGEGAVRYKNALEIHFQNVYPYASLAVSEGIVPTSLEELRKKITRHIESGEYGPLNPITPPEQQVEQHISGQFGTVFVSEIIHSFAARPFGWSDYATVYFLNELRRRGRWALKYNNDTNVDNKLIVQNIIKEQNKFTVIPATSISQELINQFVEAWKYALNIPSAPACYDSGELFALCKETDVQKGERHVSIKSILHNYKEMRKEIATFPFVSALDDAIALLEKWQAERDHKKFFELVIADKEKGKEIFDRCKSLKAFLDDQFAGYKKIRNFINDNLDNFDFLSSEDQEKSKQLYAMVADEWPVPSMKRYGLLTRELTCSLETMKKEKRNEISEKYKLVFEDLRQVCAEADVEYRINEQNVIKQMTVSDKLYVLAGNLNTSEYRAAQVQEIMERSHHVDGKPGRRTRMVTLHTGSTTPLNTEAAVDEYLAKLKLQLMEVVNSRSENDDIMVK